MSNGNTGANTSNPTIVALQQQGQQLASSGRIALKKSWKSSAWTKVVIGGVLFALLVSLSVMGNWNFFWLLLMGIVVFFIGKKLSKSKAIDKDLLWVWPVVLMVAGGLILATTIIGSGFGKLLEYSVNKVESAASCTVNPNSASCTQKVAAGTVVKRTAISLPTKYLGVANGKVLISDKYWSSFASLSGECVQRKGGAGLTIVENRRNNTVSYLAPEGFPQWVELRTTKAGGSWEGTVCK